MKKFSALCLILTLLFCLCFTGCGYEYHDLDLRAEYSRKLEGTTLTVYNWGEYISDGSEGTIDVNKEFEKLTGIKVNYLTFESNETMYSQVKSGGVNYDIVIPSDYMIERLIDEGMLAKIDTSALSNYDLIHDDYKNFTPVCSINGDVLSRAYQRLAEIQQSKALILEFINELQEELTTPDINKPFAKNSFCVSLTEGWRGEICHVIITNEKGEISEYKIKDPSFNNWYGLALAVRNNQISDFPVCNKSFNLSYCGFDL